MICLNKEYLKLLLNKLNFNEIFDLIIIHNLTLCKNFYIMIKKIGHEEDSQKNLQIFCEKSLESILLNRKGNLKLDPVSYFLLMILYNM